MIRISFLFHYQNSLPFVLDAFFTTKECEAASHPEVRYTPMCTDGASLDSELEEGEWGGRHFSGFSIQVVKDDEGLHIRSYEVPRIAFVRRGGVILQREVKALRLLVLQLCGRSTEGR